MHKILRVQVGLTRCLTPVSGVLLVVWVIGNVSPVMLTMIEGAMGLAAHPLIKVRFTLTVFVVARVVLGLLPSVTLAAAVFETAPILVGLCVALR